jgi:hypothetical protein
MSDQAPIPARPMAGLFLGGRPLLAPCVPLSLETEASRIGRRHRATVLESNGTRAHRFSSAWMNRSWHRRYSKSFLSLTALRS